MIGKPQCLWLQRLWNEFIWLKPHSNTVKTIPRKWYHSTVFSRNQVLLQAGYICLLFAQHRYHNAKSPSWLPPHLQIIFFFPFQFCLDIIEIEPCNDLTSYHDEVATTIRLVNTIISSLYFLLSLTYFSPSPPPLSSSNHLFVLCIYDSVFL